MKNDMSERSRCPWCKTNEHLDYYTDSGFIGICCSAKGDTNSEDNDPFIGCGTRSGLYEDYDDLHKAWDNS